MLSIKKTEDRQCSSNILPCRIGHDGPVSGVRRYWTPEKTEDGTPTAYFRGRKLCGKSIKLPEGYRGAVLQSTDKVLSQTPENTKAEGDEEEEGADANMEVKITEEIASFNEIIVWGHESIPADAEDAYMKGVEEWIGFAEAMHSSSHQRAVGTDAA